MFKWLKFWGNDNIDYLPPITTHTPMPPVKPCKKESDISEPVTSFLKCFKENPRRFSIVKNSRSGYYSSQTYSFKDKETSESWTVTYRPLHHKIPYIHGVKWMNDDERDLICLVIAKYYSGRAEKLSAIQKNRYAAKMNKERDRLTNIYKENP